MLQSMRNSNERRRVYRAPLPPAPARWVPLCCVQAAINLHERSTQAPMLHIMLFRLLRSLLAAVKYSSRRCQVSVKCLPSARSPATAVSAAACVLLAPRFPHTPHSDRQALTPWRQWATGTDSETALASPMLSIQADGAASTTVSLTALVDQQSNTVRLGRLGERSGTKTRGGSFWRRSTTQLAHRWFMPVVQVADLQSGNVALRVQTEQLGRTLNALSLENAQLWSEQQVQDAEYRRCASLEEVYAL